MKRFRLSLEIEKYRDADKDDVEVVRFDTDVANADDTDLEYAIWTALKACSMPRPDLILADIVNSWVREESSDLVNLDAFVEAAGEVVEAWRKHDEERDSLAQELLKQNRTG